MVHSILIFVVRTQQISSDIRNFVCQEKSKIKIFSSFSAIKLCFVINVLNNKRITGILLNLVEYSPILAISAYGLFG